MFWKKKKVEEPLDKLDHEKWLKDLLVELNLINIDNLIAMAEIVRDKEERKSLEKFLRYVQPYLLEAVKGGYTYCNTPILTHEELSEVVPGYGDILFSRLLKYGLSVYYNNTMYDQVPAEKKGIFFTVRLLKKEERNER